MNKKEKREDTVIVNMGDVVVKDKVGDVNNRILTCGEPDVSCFADHAVFAERNGKRLVNIGDVSRRQAC